MQLAQQGQLVAGALGGLHHLEPEVARTAAILGRAEGARIAGQSVEALDAHADAIPPAWRIQHGPRGWEMLQAGAASALDKRAASCSQSDARRWAIANGLRRTPMAQAHVAGRIQPAEIWYRQHHLTCHCQVDSLTASNVDFTG